MGTEDRREHTVLHPAQVDLRIVAARLLVSAQVVSPVAEAHVRGCGSEIGLPGQGAIGGERVAGEADGVAVTAQSAPAVEYQRAMVGTVHSHVVIEHMVAPEGLAESLHIFAGEVLLPVQPPEVHTLLFTGTDDAVEHIVVELGVAEVPGHHLRVLGHAHVVTQLSEEVLIVVHTVCRMEVQRYFQTVLMHPVDESNGVGDGGGVPCPACPALRVPVHVEDHHVHGNLVALHVVHNLHELVAGVTLVFAVPIAEDIEWGHGLTTGNLDEIAQGLLVLMTIAHEIPVHGLLVNRFGHPCYAVGSLVESEGGAAVATTRQGRLIDDGPSST